MLRNPPPKKSLASLVEFRTLRRATRVLCGPPRGGRRPRTPAGGDDPPPPPSHRRDAPGEEDKLYAITEGEATVFNSKGERTVRGPGECFGEQELLYMLPRSSTATCVYSGGARWT